MNVLILTYIENPNREKVASSQIYHMISDVKPEYNYVIHNSLIELPEYMKTINFGLIILSHSFLAHRLVAKRFNRIRENYSFIKYSAACKIALPQDEYDHSAFLDEWLVDWEIDRVYSCLDTKFWNVLYPNYHAIGDIQKGYTTYISDEWIEKWDFPKKHEDRKIDISYRTYPGAHNRCSLRNLKYSIADRFNVAFSEINRNGEIVCDISNKKEDLKLGEEWHRFMENSKFCLTTPSGSSVLDPYGKIVKSVLEYVRDNPNALFDKIKEECLQNVDGKYKFTALSPRNIEAALTETVQIATPGEYSSLMVEGESYLILKEDCSNVNDIKKQIKDINYVNKIKTNFKSIILDTEGLRSKNIVNEILQYTENILSLSGRSIKNDKIENDKIERYHEYCKIRYKMKFNTINLIDKVGNNKGYLSVKGIAKKYIRLLLK